MATSTADDGPSILVVDDEEVIRLVLEMLLACLGTHGPLTRLAAARPNRPDQAGSYFLSVPGAGMWVPCSLSLSVGTAGL